MDDSWRSREESRRPSAPRAPATLFGIGPFDHLVARGAVAEATSAAAWLQAQLDVEAALAAAQSTVGEIPRDAAEAITAVCRLDRIDAAAVSDAAELGGVAVIGLVEQLRGAVGGDAADFVHRGATSQDILDTAAMVVVSRAAEIITRRLADCATLVDRLADEHGATPMIGRTLGQFALPTTFTNVTGRWRGGFSEARDALGSLVASLPVQLGGPVGDGSSYGPLAAEVTSGVAERLGLVVPDRPWSTMRTPIARVAGVWGLVGSVVGDVATQLVALAGSDVGELVERAEGAGGSSSMAHKHNPVAAICARAAAMQLPGLVATLLYAASGHEFERAAGAWHAEWPSLNALLRTGGSAVDWLATSLDRIVVDVDRMAANLKVADKERST
jgi:3-carboxy-cis,cis-muconate cycloisomerase